MYFLFHRIMGFTILKFINLLKVNKEDQAVNDTDNMRVNDRSPYKVNSLGLRAL